MSKTQRGGRRDPGPGKRIGRPPKPKIELKATSGIATTVLNSLGNKCTLKLKDAESGQMVERELALPSERDCWLLLLMDKDPRMRLDTLKYLTDRRDGKPAQGVFVGDTRESARELDFGDLPELVAAGKSHPAGKPN